ncbi:MAG TPA: hypothetical protein VFF40_09870 [Acidimicrobiia bacterium]|nr:hypothetical protein [Acidimicrobiia bacterium]
MTGFEVRVRHLSGSVFAVELDVKPVELGAGDGATLAVDEPVAVVVLQGHNPIPYRVRPVEDMDGPVVNDAFGDEDSAGGVVECGDVTAVEGEHDRVFTPTGRGPPVRDDLFERGLPVGGLDDVAVFREPFDRLIDLAGM